MPDKAWITMIDEEEADEDLAAAYAECADRATGKVGHIFMIQSLNTPSLLAHHTLYQVLMFGRSPLTRIQREMIATVVSAANKCAYCLHHRSTILRRWLENDTLVDQIVKDHAKAHIDLPDRAILDFAIKLTLTPDEMTETDVQALRDAGFDDRAILDIVQIVAYYAFTNRLSNGLGLELEDFFDS
jgi:uncharacterized peroxidase-related enzyme